VTCVMLVGKEGREMLAHASIRSFLRQQWPHKELVIVNSTRDEPWGYSLLEHLNLPRDLVREIFVPRPDKEALTMGDLRNLGVDAGVGNWFLSWDDDDWSHPDRIWSLMTQRVPGHAVVPRCHVRYHVSANTAYCWRAPDGKWFRGNIALYPTTPSPFPRINHGEDTEFLEETYKGRMIHWDNRREAHHFIYFCRDDNNTRKIQEKFLGKYSEPKWRGVWVRDPQQSGFLEAHHTEYLKYILREQYALKVDGKPWPDERKND